jgi:hypothetical protein
VPLGARKKDVIIARKATTIEFLVSLSLF